MKKNLVSILILALMIVNIVLTTIMMFSVTSTAKKTSTLVTQIASVLSIELEDPTEEEDTTVLIGDMVSHDIPDSLTIPLKRGEDGKDHYYIVEASLLMNSKHEDYATYASTVANNDSYFKSIIVSVVGSYTLEEAKNNPEGMRDEILAQIQELYGSTFIYKVAFSNIMYQ